MAVWNTPSLIPQVSPPTLTDELISLISAQVKARTRSEPLTGSPGELLRALGEGPEAAHQLGDEVDGDPGVGHQEVAEGPVGEPQAAEQPALGPHGRGPRPAVEGAHLAEEVSGAERGDGGPVDLDRGGAVEDEEELQAASMLGGEPGI